MKAPDPTTPPLSSQELKNDAEEAGRPPLLRKEDAPGHIRPASESDLGEDVSDSEREEQAVTMLPPD